MKIFSFGLVNYVFDTISINIFIEDPFGIYDRST